MNEAQKLAAQLRKPEGNAGIEIGNWMNEGNKEISEGAYKSLNIFDNDTILEIGMGNGYYVQSILDSAKNVNYVGVDYSELMVEESIKNNRDAIENNRAEFIHAGLSQIPKPDNSFDKIVTVNTMYFWDNPVEDMQELARVLKPNGTLLIAIRPKGTVKAEFTKYDFNFYSEVEIETFIKSAGLVLNRFQYQKEKEIEFDGQKFELESMYVIANKK